MITIQLRPVGVYHFAFSDGCCKNTPKLLGLHLFVMKTICEMMKEYYDTDFERGNADYFIMLFMFVLLYFLLFSILLFHLKQMI